jgi:hypothetical protein
VLMIPWSRTATGNHSSFRSGGIPRGTSLIHILDLNQILNILTVNQYPDSSAILRFYFHTLQIDIL